MSLWKHTKLVSSWILTLRQSHGPPQHKSHFVNLSTPGQNIQNKSHMWILHQLKTYTTNHTIENPSIPAQNIRNESHFVNLLHQVLNIHNKSHIENPSTPAQNIHNKSHTENPSTPAQNIHNKSHSENPSTPAQNIHNKSYSENPSTPAQNIHNKSHIENPSTPAQSIHNKSHIVNPSTPAQNIHNKSHIVNPSTSAQNIHNKSQAKGLFTVPDTTKSGANATKSNTVSNGHYFSNYIRLIACSRQKHHNYLPRRNPQTVTDIVQIQLRRDSL